MPALLAKIKLALRVSTSAFDTEIESLISDCLSELEGLGIIDIVQNTVPTDPQIITAITAYCKWQFGYSDDAEKWEHIYKDKVEKLLYSSSYGLRGEE